MSGIQLYVDGCDVCLDPRTAHNVRANLAAVDGVAHLLRPGDTRSLGPAPVLDGRLCLALSGGDPSGPGAPGALCRAALRLVAGGTRVGEALALLLPRGGGLREGGVADWWLVPGGPLADAAALARPRHIVVGGMWVGGVRAGGGS